MNSPIFLLSTERSGSNLVRLILNTHPKLSAPHPFETAFPDELNEDSLQKRKFLRDILIAKNYSHHPLESALSTSEIQKSIGNDGPPLLRLQDAIYNEHIKQVDKENWVSKDPNTWKYIDSILDYYPEPKFVYLVRDARDVALSFKNSHVANTHHPYYAAKRWQWEQETGIEYMSKNEGLFHVIRYKDLLQNPEKEVEEVCEFLDLEYHEEMMYYYDTDEAVSTEKSSVNFSNLSNPIMSDNYDKFKEGLPDDEVKIVEKIAGDELQHFGYNLVNNEQELDEFKLDTKRYEKDEKKLAKKRRREHWRENTGEQLRRWLFRNFQIYLKARYNSSIL